MSYLSILTAFITSDNQILLFATENPSDKKKPVNKCFAITEVSQHELKGNYATRRTENCT